MIVTCVHVYVKKEHIDDFKKASIKNHNSSVHEPGNLRFDVLQSTKKPSQFMLYEAYESEEAAAAHKETAHYLEWKRTVADWMAQPREGVPYKVICPEDRSKWLFQHLLFHESRLFISAQGSLPAWIL
ncbi:MAG TPA: antibiotic biosynthesis monooxygenase [bacterium]|nr:antibiotic biosynthesis monooxygenase [bacterium]